MLRTTLFAVLPALALARYLRARRLAARATSTPPAKPKPTPPPAGFHRRPLPSPAVAMSAAEGRAMAKEAMTNRTMEVFFPLSECFETQSEPAFCGLGTLVTVLNTLEVDPGCVWKGAWRWYDAKMLDCCVDLDEVAKRGLTFDEWLCLARCQGLSVDEKRTTDSSLDEFRAAVWRGCAWLPGEEAVLCVSYSRKPLQQSGDGHFSPIGGYHAPSDRVLIMDVARFKHPPHWVPLPLLWEAMERPDSATGRARGFATLSRKRQPGVPRGAHAAIVLTFGRTRCEAALAFVEKELPRLAQSDDDVPAELWRAARSLPAAVASLVGLPAASSAAAAGGPGATDAHVAAVRAELQGSAIFVELSRAASSFGVRRDGPLPLPVEVCSALLLVLGGAVDEAVLARALPRSWRLLVGGGEPEPEGEALGYAVAEGEPRPPRTSSGSGALRAELAVAREHVREQILLATTNVGGCCTLRP